MYIILAQSTTIYRSWIGVYLGVHSILGGFLMLVPRIHPSPSCESIQSDASPFRTTSLGKASK